MTTGFLDFAGGGTSFPTSPGGRIQYKSWSGADRTPLPRARREKKTVMIWVKSSRGAWKRVPKTIWRLPGWETPPGHRPPKRIYDVPHAYSLDAASAEEYQVDLRIPTCLGSEWGSTPSTGAAFRDFGATVWAPAPLLDYNNDVLKLILKLREKVNGSSFNMTQFLAEAPLALQMIGDSAIRIAKSLRRLKKGDFYGAARALLPSGAKPRKPPPGTARQDIASQWLELQYGWKPLLGDARDGAQMLAHVLNYPRVLRFKVRVRKEEVSERVSEWGVISSPCGSRLYHAYGKATRTHIIALRAFISEKPSIPKLLGLMDPEVVAWELVPFSFVADWFLPIGDWLQARAFSQGLTGTFVWSDLRTGVRHVPYGDFDLSSSGSAKPWKRTLFGRTVDNSLLVPMPKVVPLSEALSVTRTLNAIALVSQFFKPGPGRVRT